MAMAKVYLYVALFVPIVELPFIVYVRLVIIFKVIQGKENGTGGHCRTKSVIVGQWYILYK